MVADDRWDAAVGSVAEEAARLLDSLRRQTRAERGSEPGAAPERHGDDDGHEHEHVHVPMGEAAACSYCPVCRGVVLLRSVSPETLDRLADLAGTAAALLADLASVRSGPSGPGPDAPRATRAEPIDVVDEED